MLEIKNLSVSIQEKKILKDFSLSISPGEIHVLFGPNGIGKSTLGFTLMGFHQQEKGHIYINKEEISSSSIQERAQKGLFLGYQYPVSIPGVRIGEFLKSLAENRGFEWSFMDFRREAKKHIDRLQLPSDLLGRNLNEGLSGGEMKRLELLQMNFFKPHFAVLDEIDSGVDIEAQKLIVQEIKNMARQENTGFLIITHYKKIIEELNPHKIHILLDGKIARSGGLNLIEEIEQHGFSQERT